MDAWTVFAGPAFDRCSLSDVAALVSTAVLLLGLGFIVIGFKSLKEVRAEIKHQSQGNTPGSILKIVLASIILIAGLIPVYYAVPTLSKALGCLGFLPL